MRRLQHCVILLAAALAVACAAAPAQACVLAGPPPTPAQKVRLAQVAFTGTVTASAPLADFAGTRMTVAVDRVVKGAVPATVELVAGITSCAQTFAVGERVGLAMSPATPVPWAVNVYDVLAPAALDALPVEAAYRRVAIAAVAAPAAGRAIQVHVRARRCAELRPALTETADGITVAMTAADGAACTRGARVDRCVELRARRAIGARTVRPRGARRVARSSRCAPAS